MKKRNNIMGKKFLKIVFIFSLPLVTYGQHLSIMAGANSNQMIFTGLNRLGATQPSLKNYRNYFFVGLLHNTNVGRKGKTQFKTGILYNPKRIVDGGTKAVLEALAVPINLEREIYRCLEIETGLQVDYMFKTAPYAIKKFGVSYNVGPNIILNETNKLRIGYNGTIFSQKKIPETWEVYFRCFNISIQHKI